MMWWIKDYSIRNSKCVIWAYRYRWATTANRNSDFHWASGRSRNHSRHVMRCAYIYIIYICIYICTYLLLDTSQRQIPIPCLLTIELDWLTCTIRSLNWLIDWLIVCVCAMVVSIMDADGRLRNHTTYSYLLWYILYGTICIIHDHTSHLIHYLMHAHWNFMFFVT